MKRWLAPLALGVVAPCLVCGQVAHSRRVLSTFPGGVHRLLKQQEGLPAARSQVPVATGQVGPCEPGPVQGLVDIPGGWCEGLAVDNNGNIFTADLVTNNVYRITPQGQTTLYANLYAPSYDPNNPEAYLDGAKGMAFSMAGDLWICNPTPTYADKSRHGLYRVSPGGRAELAVPMNFEEAPFPNGLTFDPQGNLYITESKKGGIWKVHKGQGVASLWLADQLLEPTGGFGANGIAFKDGAIFITNSDQVTLVKVPINHDGSPGIPTIFAYDFGWPDGLTVGPSGDLYLIGGWDDWQLVRVADDGTWRFEVLSGMTGTASLAFGKTHGDKTTVYMSNFGSSWDAQPTVLKIELCKH